MPSAYQAFVIFDLDNTLVDSAHLKPLRDRRAWPAVYAELASVRLFPGIAEAWEELRTLRVHLSVVTHAPRPYAERVLQRVGLMPDALVAYHDLRGRKKPMPHGYQQATEGLGDVKGWAVGDEETDIEAADAMPCAAIAAGWCRMPLDEEHCRARGWDYARSPLEIVTLLRGIDP